MRGGATFSATRFSPNREFRYRLWRTWDEAKPKTLVVIGCNPSIADESRDDPTIRRCVGFAKREACGSLVMLNLFALVATDPRQLGVLYMRGRDIIGPSNDAAIVEAARLPNVFVVAAWGGHGQFNHRDRQVCELLRAAGVQLKCLGKTRTGAPRHPLYLRADTPFIPYSGFRA